MMVEPCIEGVHSHKMYKNDMRHGIAMYGILFAAFYNHMFTTVSSFHVGIGSNH